MLGTEKRFPSLLILRMSLKISEKQCGQWMPHSSKYSNTNAAGYIIIMVSFLQRLGSLSSNNTVFSYQVPAMTQLSDDSDDLVDIINDTANLNIAFSLLQSEVIKNGHDSITVAELLYV